jgi:hypothetical protein
MKLDVYQIRGDYQEADDAYRALALKGSENFEPEMLGVFRRVCTVDTFDELPRLAGPCLEFVWRVLNAGWEGEQVFNKHVSGYNIIGQVENGIDNRRRDMHSLSVGDIVVFEGDAYMCDPIGFKCLGGFIEQREIA